MVVLDATTLMLLIDPAAKPPTDETTELPVEKCQERIEFLVRTLDEARTPILIPTPVLAEVLVRAGAGRQQFLNEITNTYAFRIISFDERAAVELSMLLDPSLNPGVKLTGLESKAKVKFDRQIVAIAKVNGARTIYSDDGGVKTVSERNGISVVRTVDLPLPPVEAQGELAFPEQAENDDER